MNFEDFRKVVEGKSFKGNDEDSKAKKAKEKERQQGRDEKKKRTDETLEESLARFDAEFAGILEGKSFKRNKDEDADDKKKQDKERRDTQRGKQERTDEASDLSFNDAKRELPQVKDKLGKMGAFHPEYVKTKARYDSLRDRLSRMQDDDGELDESESGKVVGDHELGALFGDEDLASSFIEATCDMIKEYDDGELTQEDITKIANEWLERHDIYDVTFTGVDISDPNHFKWTVAGAGGELDEASDISFNDAKAELPQIKHQLSKMTAFDPEYIKTKARHDTLKDRLSRMQDDDLDESEDALDEESEGGESWCVVGGTGKVVAGPFASRTEAVKHVKYAGETVKAGTPASLSTYEESYVDDVAGYSGDSKDVVEHQIGDIVTVKEGRYAGLKGEIVKEGPGPYLVVKLTGGKQVRYGHDELVNESYVSGDDDSGSDDVIEGTSNEDCILPRNQAKSLADEVETTDDEGKKVSVSDIERMKQLAGMNKI